MADQQVEPREAIAQAIQNRIVQHYPLTEGELRRFSERAADAVLAVLPTLGYEQRGLRADGRDDPLYKQAIEDAIAAVEAVPAIGSGYIEPYAVVAALWQLREGGDQ